MVKSFISGYFRLFDETLGNSTYIVLIIALLITSVGNIANAGYYNKDTLASEVINLNGKTYKLVD